MKVACIFILNFFKHVFIINRYLIFCAAFHHICLKRAIKDGNGNRENIKENVGRGNEPACYVMVIFLRQLPNIFCEDNLVIRYLT